MQRSFLSFARLLVLAALIEKKWTVGAAVSATCCHCPRPVLSLLTHA
jgi:hypothetical protein